MASQSPFLLRVGGIFGGRTIIARRRDGIHEVYTAVDQEGGALQEIRLAPPTEDDPSRLLDDAQRLRGSLASVRRLDTDLDRSTAAVGELGASFRSAKRKLGIWIAKFGGGKV